MTVEQFKKDFETSLYKSLEINRLRSPYDTGNLRYSGIKFLKTPNGFKIYVDENVAPYAIYLDGFESINARYPEGWWSHICLKIINDMIKKYDKEQYNSDEWQEGLGNLKAIREFNKSTQALNKGATYGKSAKSAGKYVLGSTGSSIRSVRENVSQHQISQYQRTGRSYYGYNFID